MLFSVRWPIDILFRFSAARDTSIDTKIDNTSQVEVEGEETRTSRTRLEAEEEGKVMMVLGQNKTSTYADTKWCVMYVNMHRLQAATSLMGLSVRSGSRLAGKKAGWLRSQDACFDREIPGQINAARTKDG